MPHGEREITEVPPHPGGLIKSTRIWRYQASRSLYIPLLEHPPSYGDGGYTPNIQRPREKTKKKKKKTKHEPTRTHERVEFDVLEGLSIRCSNGNQVLWKCREGCEARQDRLLYDPGESTPSISVLCVPRWWASARVRAETSGCSLVGIEKGEGKVLLLL